MTHEAGRQTWDNLIGSVLHVAQEDEEMTVLHIDKAKLMVYVMRTPSATHTVSSWSFLYSESGN